MTTRIYPIVTADGEYGPHAVQVLTAGPAVEIADAVVAPEYDGRVRQQLGRRILSGIGVVSGLPVVGVEAADWRGDE